MCEAIGLGSSFRRLRVKRKHEMPITVLALELVRIVP